MGQHTGDGDLTEEVQARVGKLILYIFPPEYMIGGKGGYARLVRVLRFGIPGRKGDLHVSSPPPPFPPSPPLQDKGMLVRGKRRKQNRKKDKDRD